MEELVEQARAHTIITIMIHMVITHSVMFQKITTTLNQMVAIIHGTLRILAFTTSSTVQQMIQMNISS
mgnify:CR=1 FL=1